MNYKKLAERARQCVSMHKKGGTIGDTDDLLNTLADTVVELSAELDQLKGEPRAIGDIPCKLGDTVYSLRENWAAGETGKIYEGKVYGCELPNMGRSPNPIIWYKPDAGPNNRAYALELEDYRKTWFLSYEEAMETQGRRKVVNHEL